MAYQNNNNRIVPDAMKDTTIHPQASPVDKLVKYQPDLSGVAESRANARALAQIGRGLIDIDPKLHKNANETVIAAYEKTEAKNNKKEWADVSKNVKGMAKFNPYLKDSYRSLVAQDIYRMSVLKINSNPNLYKLSTEEFDKFIQDTKTQMYDAMKESKLDPQHYADLFEKFSQNCYQTAYHYTQKNSEYTYKNTLIQQGNDLAFQAGVNTYNLSDGDKTQALISTINQKVEACLAQGIPKDDIVNNIIATGLQSYIIDNADTISSAALEAALNNLTVDGTPVRDIMPNFNYTMHQMIKQAKRASYDDRKADYDNEKLTLKINSDNATRDFFNWFKNNQNASPNEVQAQALSLIDQYGIDEDGLGFIQDVARTKGIMTSIKQTTSDNSVLTELGRKAALGTLTGEEIANALNNGSLSWEDGLKFSDRINREAAKTVKEVEHDFNQLNTKLSKNGIYGKALKGTPELQQYIDMANQVMVDLDNGTDGITPEDAKRSLQNIENYALGMMNRKKNTTDINSLLDANYIRSQTLPSYTFESASNAFKNLGYIRGGLGQKVKGNITSGINPNRNINGVVAPHRGYDIGAKEGTVIMNCNMKGTVVKAGNLPDAGNFVIIQYENGTYARFLHLKNTTSHLEGRTIYAGQPFAYVGNTGHSTGAHLHVDFWNRNKELINVENFAKGIK